MRAEHREAWTKLLGRNPNTGTQILRATNARAYSWLYRNDRTWLSSVIASRNISFAGNGSKVNWYVRDEQLALAVRKMAAQLAETTGKARFTIAALCAAIPGLRPKLGALDRLPSTVRALRDVAWTRKGTANKSGLV